MTFCLFVQVWKLMNALFIFLLGKILFPKLRSVPLNTGKNNNYKFCGLWWVFKYITIYDQIYCNYNYNITRVRKK